MTARSAIRKAFAKISVMPRTKVGDFGHGVAMHDSPHAQAVGTILRSKPRSGERLSPRTHYRIKNHRGASPSLSPLRGLIRPTSQSPTSHDVGYLLSPLRG